MPTAALTDLQPDEQQPKVANLSDLQAPDQASDATDYLKQYAQGDPAYREHDAGMLQNIINVKDEWDKASNAEYDAAKGMPTWQRAAQAVYGGVGKAFSNVKGAVSNYHFPGLHWGNTPEDWKSFDDLQDVNVLKPAAEFAQGAVSEVGRLPGVAANLATGAMELNPAVAMLETLPTPLRDPTQRLLARERGAADVLQHVGQTGAMDIAKTTGISNDTAAAMIGNNALYALIPFGELGNAETIANAVDRSTNMVGNAIGGAKWMAAKSAPMAVGAAKTAVVDTALRKMGVNTGIDELLALWAGFGGKAASRNPEIANKIAQWTTGKSLEEIADTAATQATKPLGMTSNEAWSQALKQKAQTTQEAIDGLLKDMDAKDAAKVTEKASDGSLKYATEDLGKEGQNIRAKMQEAADYNTKANAILKRNDLQKLYDSGVQSFGNMLVHTVQGAGMGAAFAGSQAPTGATEDAVAFGSTLGGALGLVTAPFATRAGMYAQRLTEGRKALINISDQAKNVVGDISGLDKPQQDFVKVLAGQADVLGGKKVFVESEDQMRENGNIAPDADPGHGFVDIGGNIHLNADTIPSKAGNHEYTHVTQRFFGELLRKLHPDEVAKFEDNYKDALSATGRQRFDSPRERDAEVGRYILNNTPIEYFYGGERGGDVVRRIMSGIMGKGKMQTWGGFEVPFNRVDLQNMRDRFFRAGELAKMQDGAFPAPAKPPEVPYSMWTNDQAAKFNRAFELNKQQGMTDADAFKNVIDNTDFLPKRRAGQSVRDAQDEAWERYYALAQQQTADIAEGRKPSKRLRKEMYVLRDYSDKDNPQDIVKQPMTVLEAEKLMAGYQHDFPNEDVRIEKHVPKPEEGAPEEAKPVRTELPPYQRVYGWMAPDLSYVANEGRDIHADTITKILHKEGKLPSDNYYNNYSDWYRNLPEEERRRTMLGSMEYAYEKGWDNGYVRLRESNYFDSKGRVLTAHLPGKYKLSPAQIDALGEIAESNGITRVTRDAEAGEDKVIFTSPFFDPKHFEDDEGDWLPKLKKGMSREEQQNLAWEKYYALVHEQNKARDEEQKMPSQLALTRRQNKAAKEGISLQEATPASAIKETGNRPQRPVEVYGWLTPDGQYIENQGGDIHADTITKLLHPDMNYGPLDDGLYHDVYGGMTEAYHAGFEKKYLRLTSIGDEMYVHYPEQYGDISRSQREKLQDLAMEHNMRVLSRDSESFHPAKEPIMWENPELKGKDPYEYSYEWMPKNNEPTPFFVERHGDVYAVVDRRRPNEVGLITPDLQKANERKNLEDRIYRAKEFGRIGASGIWDRSTVDPEMNKIKEDAALATGADPKKRFYEQTPAVQKALTEHMIQSQGADFMPKQDKSGWAEGRGWLERGGLLDRQIQKFAKYRASLPDNTYRLPADFRGYPDKFGNTEPIPEGQSVSGWEPSRGWLERGGLLDRQLQKYAAYRAGLPDNTYHLPEDFQGYPEKGVDYMPKPLQVAEGIKMELDRRAEDFIAHTPYIHQFGKDEDGLYALKSALADSVSGKPLPSDVQTVHDKLGIDPSQFDVIADGFKNTVNRDEIKRRVEIGSLPAGAGAYDMNPNLQQQLRDTAEQSPPNMEGEEWKDFMPKSSFPMTLEEADQLENDLMHPSMIGKNMPLTKPLDRRDDLIGRGGRIVSPDSRGDVVTGDRGFSFMPKPNEPDAIKQPAYMTADDKVVSAPVAYHSQLPVNSQDYLRRGFRWGFVTNSHEFVNREDAFNLAREHGQLRDPNMLPRGLHTTDLNDEWLQDKEFMPKRDYDPNFVQKPPMPDNILRRAMMRAYPPGKPSNEAKVAKIGQARDIPKGTPVDIRIDIPTFNKTGLYAQTVHEPGIGTVQGYDSMVKLDGPLKFSVNERLAKNVKEGKMSKSPFAVVKGTYDPARWIPPDINDTQEWTPVGFNPMSHGYFYDKETGIPVEGGSKAIMIDNTAYVKDADFGDPANYEYMPKTDENLDEKYPAPIVSPAIKSRDGTLITAPSHIKAYIKELNQWDNSDPATRGEMPTISRDREGFVDKNGDFLNRLDSSQRVDEVGQLPFAMSMGGKEPIPLTSELFNEYREFMPKTPEEVKPFQDLMAKLFPESITPTFKRDKQGNYKLFPVKNSKGQIIGYQYEGEQRPWNLDQSQLYKDVNGGFTGDSKKGALIKQDDGTFKTVSQKEMDANYIKALAQKIADEYRNVWTKDPMAMMARGWYREFTQKLADKIGPEHAELFAQMLSTTSPGNSAFVNFKFTLEAYNNLISGRYDDVLAKFHDAYAQYKLGELKDSNGEVIDSKSGFNAYLRKNNILALQQSGKKLGKYSLPAMFTLGGHFWELAADKGLKISQFVNNLSGKDIHNPTIDLWATRTSDRLSNEGVDKWRDLPMNEGGVGDRDYNLQKAAYKQAAKMVGENVTDLQAIAWFGEKIHYGKNGWIRGGPGASLGDFRPLIDATVRKPGTLKELELPKGVKPTYAPVKRIELPAEAQGAI